jgi:uncharacterized protein YegP (UPF0339 family)
MFFELYKDTLGQYRWRLYATDGRKVADSGEGLIRQVGLQAGIELVKSTNSQTPVM